MIKLQRANINDSSIIYEMQVEAFKELLEKYNDRATNPGAESIDQVIRKLKQDSTDYYVIKLENSNIGAIRIVKLSDNTCRISPMFILPEYQENGYGKQVITEIEKLYLEVNIWQLDTIKEEVKLCQFYEKMGYEKTGKEDVLKEGMTILYYIKRIKY